MSLLRSILYSLVMVVFTPIFVTLFLLFFWLPLRQRHLFCRGWVWTAIWMIEHILGIRYEVRGGENIPPGACVVMSKHQSAWETIVLQKIFVGSVFVMKRELYWIPFFGWALALNPMVGIDRAAGRDALRQVVSRGTERLKEGYRVIIYPEGTRIAPGKKGEYKRGGSILARQAGFPVCPVALNAGELWAKNAFVKKPGLVTVSIGPAIEPENLKAEEIGRRAETWIEDEMRRISPHLYPPSPTEASVEKA